MMCKVFERSNWRGVVDCWRGVVDYVAVQSLASGGCGGCGGCFDITLNLKIDGEQVKSRE